MERIGGYRLVAPLGGDSEGQLWRAERDGSGSPVVVRLLPPAWHDPSVLARLAERREALCSLRHPNLVPVLDVVTEGGAALVSELVEGTDLGTTLASFGVLAPPIAVATVSGPLAALGALHDHGLVHGSVRPERILIGADGVRRLTGFGLAGIGPEAVDVLRPDTGYVAPELLAPTHGRPPPTATAPADVYACGAVLYQALCGWTPWVASGRKRTPVPPRPVGVPDALWSALLALLAEYPGLRPPPEDAVARLTALTAELEGCGPLVMARPVPLPAAPVSAARPPNPPNPPNPPSPGVVLPNLPVGSTDPAAAAIGASQGASPGVAPPPHAPAGAPPGPSLPPPTPNPWIPRPRPGPGGDWAPPSPQAERRPDVTMRRDWSLPVLMSGHWKWAAPVAAIVVLVVVLLATTLGSSGGPGVPARSGVSHRGHGRAPSHRHGGAGETLAVPFAGASFDQVAADTTVQRGGNLTVAIGSAFPGWNVDTSRDAGPSLQQVMDLVWPQPFVVDDDLAPALNTQLLESVTLTDTNPETIVYRINPKAVWSDGAPIDAADFVYNFEARSGDTAYADTDALPFDVVSTDGYADILSVTGSDPPAGQACTTVVFEGPLPSAPCGNGDSVTVVFFQRYADWPSLFADLVPEHVAAAEGWNTGFDDWHNVVSGSWYEIADYVPGRTVVLQRNPRYWSRPGELRTITFEVVGDAAAVDDLARGQVDLIDPAAVTAAGERQVAGLDGIVTKVEPGLAFEHLDFNESDACLAHVAVRRAIALGTDRAAIVAATVARVDPAAAPLDDDIFLPGEAGYRDDGSAYAVADDAAAMGLLASVGLRRGGDGYVHGGCAGTGDLTLDVSVPSSDGWAATAATVFARQMAGIGVMVDPVAVPTSRFFATVLPTGRFQLALYASEASPFPTAVAATYCSYTDNAQCPQNVDHYADPAEDADLAAGTAATSAAAEITAFDAADRQLWTDMATLPLFQLPRLFAWSGRYGNVLPDTASAGPAWNAADWGLVG